MMNNYKVGQKVLVDSEHVSKNRVVTIHDIIERNRERVYVLETNNGVRFETYSYNMTIVE